MSLKIVYKNPNELKEYENNPRINEEAVEVVMASIEKFGFLVPILIDDTDLIITGDTRKKAAVELNLKEIPCIYVNDLSVDQIKAFRLVENKTSEFAQWDMDKLMKELEELTDFAELSEIFKFPEINTDDVNVTDDDFIKATEFLNENKPKTLVCPKCGEAFEV